MNKEEKNCGLLLYQKSLDEGINPIGVGIIGARVLPQNWVARKPSNIYWNGIRTYHIFEQENMTIPDMVRLSVLLRAQAKPDKGCSIDLLLEFAELFEVSTDYLLTGRLIYC